MKKIVVSKFYQSEIFEISKFIYGYFKDHQITLHKHHNKLILRFPKNVDRLKIEEIKTYIQVKYPHIQIIVNLEY